MSTVNIVLLFLNIICLIWLGIITYLYQKNIKDKKKVVKRLKEKGVDGYLQEIIEKNSQLERDIYKLYEASKEIKNIATKSISKKAIIRYNPFGDTGGDQSFSIALLDSQDNGLIISSLHGRSDTRIYAKPIINGKANHNLTEEEKDAIKKAQRGMQFSK